MGLSLRFKCVLASQLVLRFIAQDRVRFTGDQWLHVDSGDFRRPRYSPHPAQLAEEKNSWIVPVELFTRPNKSKNKED